MDLDLRAPPDRAGASRRWARPPRGWLLGAAAVLMVAAWVGGNPPGMSVDEPAHYRKAVGISHLDVRGEPAGYEYVPANTASMRAWLNRTSRAVTVPSELQGCHAFRLPLRGRCPRIPAGVVDRPLRPDQEVTYVGTYPPFVYLVPAGPMRVAEALGGDAGVVLSVGRAAMAALCLALLIAAGFLLTNGRGGRAALVGLVLCLSPMVLFLVGELAASGPEVAASVCLMAAALALTRDDGPALPAAVWAALAASALVLTTSRSVGPVWLVVLLAVVVALRGPRVALEVARSHRRAAAMTAAVSAVGVVATVVWRVIVEPKPAVRVSDVVGGLWPGLRQVPSVLAQGIGSFGWFDVDMPWPLYAVWAVLVVALVGLALTVGSARERGVLVALVALEVVGTVVFFAVVIRPTSPDFKMQGRYVLPLLVALPLVAGEVLGGHPRRVASVLRDRVSTVFPVATVAAVAVHGLAWVANARYYQDGAVFRREYPARWEPWGGWPLWALVAAGAVALAWLALVAGGRTERVAAVRPDE